MPVTAFPDALLTITVDDVDVSCNVINFNLSKPTTGDGTIVLVACGDSYSEPGDPQPGALSGEIYEDFLAAGFTRMLWEHDNEQVPFTVVKNPGTTHEASFSGEVVLKAPPVAGTPGKTARNQFSLPVVTAALAPAASGS